MGLLFPEDMYLFSGIKGTLTYEGKPQANVKIKLYIMDPNRDELEYFYITNDKGEFEIPEVKKKIRTAPFQQVVITARIYTYLNGEEQYVWSSYKHNGKRWREIGGEPLDMVCELTTERIRLTSPWRNTVTSVCRWTEFKYDPGIPDYMLKDYTDHFTPREY